MIRALLRIVLLIIVVAAIAAFFIGYRVANPSDTTETQDAVGTGGQTVERERGAVDIDRAREAGARLGESVADGAYRARLLTRDAGLTAKITSKMALDDLVKARTIDVDTSNGVVTLRGSVASSAEHDRAMQLARETEGVSAVTDLLVVRP